MNLSERDAKVIWHPYTQMQTAGLPVAIVRGEGARLYDETGKEYIDAISSWWVNVHGHANQYIAQKVVRAASKAGACHLRRLYASACSGTCRTTSQSPAAESVENFLLR